MSESLSQTLLARLVSFATVSRESNLGLIGFIHGYLAQHGIACELFHNAQGTKANLFATIGPTDRAGIMLSGHTDVVPVDGQAWSFDPFTLTERDGRLYGRGTADMKGFIACVLAAVPSFIAKPLKTPIHLAFSYDEEVGCLGVRSLLERLSQTPNKPRICLIGEPTELKPVLGHKGKLAMRCQVHGVACHSAYAPSGVNAIEYAAEIITKLREMGEALKPLQDARFEPPYSTIQTGVIHGGRALNIVPEHCEFDFEVRTLPGFDPIEVVHRLTEFTQHALVPKMQAVDAQSHIEFEPLSSYPGLATAQDSEAATWIADLCQSDAFATVAFGTEGGLFAELGITTVVCGPGSMDQGHKPDEYVSLEQLDRCDAMLARLAQLLRA
jgi:acetylornithine deacetylase